MITEITSGVVYLSTSSWKLDYITVQNRMLRFDLSNTHLHKSLSFPARSKLGITYQGAQLSCTHPAQFFRGSLPVVPSQ